MAVAGRTLALGVGRGVTWTGCAESLIRVVARREAWGGGGFGGG